jgi:uncharacterized protein YndB with AHSA1/START domain
MGESLVTEVIRKSIRVECSVEEAFRVFTSDALSWWPVESHSIHTAVSDIVFEDKAGGDVYEVSATGEKGHWATVLEWQPPHRLVLAWNILHADALGTEVEVRFLPEGDGTKVELEHRGWERLEEGGEAKRSSYDGGWDFVLGKYVERVA